MFKKIFLISLIIFFCLPIVAAAEAADPWQGPDYNDRGGEEPDAWEENPENYIWNVMKGGATDRGGGLNTMQLVAYGQEGETELLPATVLRVVSIFLGLLGIIFLIIILYAGFTWLTSGGNEEKVTKAKSLLKNGLIGLVIILTAYAITLFVFEMIL